MKLFKTAIITFIVLCLFGIGAHAQGTNDEIDEEINSYGTDELYDSLDGSTKQALSEIGVDGISFASVHKISPADIFNLIKNTFAGKSGSVFKSMSALAVITAVSAAAQALVPDDKKKSDIIGTVALLSCAAVICVPVMNTVKGAVAAVIAVCAFIKTLIPVMAGILIASGSPSGAASFQMFAFAAAQFISSAAGSYAVPVISSVISLDIAGAALPDYNLDGISSFIKKALASVISFATVMYVSFLGIKDILCDSADSLGVKGVKLLINSAVPVIGAPLSELYGSLTSTASLVKSTAGVFAIIAVAVISLIPAADVILNIFVLRVFGAVSGIFRLDRISKLLNSVAGALTLMNIILILNSAMFVISVFLILNKGA